jgi:centrin-1
LKYDKRLKGSFGVNELLEVARELCENVDEEVLMEIVGRIDSNGDGKVTFEDFYNVMTKEVYS